MAFPNGQKIYHIVHWDRLPSILQWSYLYSDKLVRNHNLPGTPIGYDHLKERRLIQELTSHPGLHVGECVPFYYCPRSPMLYTKNIQTPVHLPPAQIPIIHLEFDLNNAINWAQSNNKRWALTTGNASSRYFEDYANISDFARIDWEIIGRSYWQDVIDKKQAEFLIEDQFPFNAVELIGIYPDNTTISGTTRSLSGSPQASKIQVKKNWYY